MTNLTAKVAQVKIGTIEIEGLMFSDGSFGVAVPQLAALFPYFKTDTNNASIYLKRLMGKDFKTDKVKTEFNRNVTLSVDLIGFERVLRKLDKACDPVAESLSENLIGLSLHQLFCDGFGITFEKEDRQKWLVERMESKELFAELTTAIKETREAAGKEISFFHYSTPADAINRGLFGKTAKQIREELGTAKQALNRDNFGKRSLRWITNVQEAAARRVRAGQKPCDAIATVISELGYTVIDYHQ